MKMYGSLLSVILAAWIVAGLVTGSNQAMAQAAQQSSRAGGKDKEEAKPSIDAETGKVLNEAIELINKEDYTAAQQKISTLKKDRLSPYELTKVEQILYMIAFNQEKFDEARQHLQAAIDAGGMNDQEKSEARFQTAQIFMTQEKWKEGAAALEEWLKTAEKPNSASYYLLAIAYYRMDEFERALVPAKKAVEMMEKPQENWISLLMALYVQREEYKEAIPVLQRLVELVPNKKTYWMQLSSIYGQIEDYPNALATMQLAHFAGLVTEDSELRRLADLLLYNDVPYRGAQILEEGIEKKTLKLDEKLYEKLANCWLAAGEFDKAIPALQRVADMAATGDGFVRLAEVQIQREDWASAENALQRAVDKGQLRDSGNANVLMGVALYNQDKLGDARTWFQRARNSDKHRQIAMSYLQAIESKL